MRKEELCNSCIIQSFCQFRALADNVAKLVPKEKTPEQAHMAISNLRIAARNMKCPRVNTVDPKYPGKESL